ncbi:hypothetical protein C7T94_00100 [Pedobacter yulinensis]|uniref:Uncharacterized protein n=1 Tax=Pedobacter yulinensis TaxID=2126353 RepID=A0A2T3HQB5_9SPHI|nr:hypothetical protein [Pedobacter yulinensis]PST84577.1 hypothetical protein C7T94_00100 [Pedobacter yulinensis]
MKLSEHPDLKKTITALPAKEKDKLLLRLLAKDKVLTEHLHFKLLENAADLEDRKDKLRALADEAVPEMERLNAKEALTRLRKLMKELNHFVKVTKDAEGEVELKIYLLSVVPLTYKSKTYSFRDYAILFNTYYTKAVAAVLVKFGKLHEDLQFDLTEALNGLLRKIYASKMAGPAAYQGLPEKID